MNILDYFFFRLLRSCGKKGQVNGNDAFNNAVMVMSLLLIIGTANIWVSIFNFYSIHPAFILIVYPVIHFVYKKRKGIILKRFQDCKYNSRIPDYMIWVIYVACWIIPIMVAIISKYFVNN